MCERVKVADAARELGMGTMAVRVRMDRGLLPIGYVFRGEKRSDYVIYRDKLDAYLGKGKS